MLWFVTGVTIIYRQTYKGKYKPKNKDKYIGDIDNVVYRSSWERAALKWLDNNPSIVKYAAEEIVIPYLCETDNQIHRYYVDLWFQTTDGSKYLIEIKPKKETIPPKKSRGKPRNRYLNESLTYIKNQSKWNAASKFAQSHGWTFQVWTEDTMRKIGIKVL